MAAAWGPLSVFAVEDLLISVAGILNSRRMCLPLLEERTGVRTVVKTDFLPGPSAEGHMGFSEP
jgi:hypothetical protein